MKAVKLYLDENTGNLVDKNSFMVYANAATSGMHIEEISDTEVDLQKLIAMGVTVDEVLKLQAVGLI